MLGCHYDLGCLLQCSLVTLSADGNGTLLLLVANVPVVNAKEEPTRLWRGNVVNDRQGEEEISRLLRLETHLWLFGTRQNPSTPVMLWKDKLDAECSRVENTFYCSDSSSVDSETCFGALSSPKSIQDLASCGWDKTR